MKKNKNITCRIFLILGLIILSQPALAQKVEPQPTAYLCFEPESGRQVELDTADATAGTCPDEYQLLVFYEVRRLTGPAPLQEIPKQHEKTEVRDAASEQR